MRKRYKNKKCSCSLCKPHKRGLDRRRTPKDEALLKEFEHENDDYRIRTQQHTNPRPSSKAA